MRNKYFWEGTTSNGVFWAIVRDIISIRLACAAAQEKRQEGRKAVSKKSQEVYISRMCGATLSINININICSIELKWDGKITKIWYDNEMREYE